MNLLFLHNLFGAVVGDVPAPDAVAETSATAQPAVESVSQAATDAAAQAADAATQVAPAMEATSFLPFTWSEFFRALVILVVGIPVVVTLSKTLAKIGRKKFTEHHSVIFQKLSFYIGMAIVLAMVLMQLKFDITALVGAAGILTLAVGFASQTTLSNLISGLFVLGEKTFRVGDLVRVNGTLGVVHSIDLLSVKLRTLDNLYIRVPNEEIIKSQFTNITKFPIRRMDIIIGVAYKEDICRVMEVLQEEANKNPYVLDEPEPLLLVKDFNTSSIDIQLGLWFESSNFRNVRNNIMPAIKERFDKEGIEIPFPHVTLYTGAECEPFPMRSVDK